MKIKGTKGNLSSRVLILIFVLLAVGLPMVILVQGNVGQEMNDGW